MWYAIVLGGGLGARMHAGRNKVVLTLGGEMVLLRSIRAMLPHVKGVIAVVRPEDEKDIRRAIGRSDMADANIIYAPGGCNRQASVLNGLSALPEDCRYVMIHDGARCLVDDETIQRVKVSVEACGTGVAAVPVIDTIKEVDENERVTQTPARSTLRSVQTPQGFTAALIRQAHEFAQAHDFTGTDDASLLEYMGHPVQLVEGARRNLKLTIPEDMMIGNAYLAEEAGLPSLRVGQGYDVHRFAEDRKLVLCGVEVPHTQGLLGHSDADVAVHALMDAMLGAMALGDIGRHFPDSDPQYRGISSMKLLEHVVALLGDQQARVTNADITIVAQKPKLLPYIQQMQENIAHALNLPLSRVNVKATTTEKLGFEGREEGISAQAVCMVESHSVV